ncbi:MAG: 2-hydroxyacid dehydrogenase, partial [Candidatus Bathyarchaeia archaeon]
DVQGDPKQFLPYITDAEILITHLARIDASVIDAGERLKVIGIARGGPVNVDVDEATKRKIPVLYAPGRNAESVADLTIGLLIAEARGIARAHSSLIAGHWRFDFYSENLLGVELEGKVLGLVGCGHVGRKVIERAKGFGMRLYVYDPYVPIAEVESLGAKSVDLDSLLKESDFISIHARLTKETEELIGKEAFEKMKPTAILINTARGGIVDEAALYEALRDRRIAGAAIDTFKEEPLYDSPLLKLDNITVTPHIGSATREVALRSARLIAEEVASYIAGRRPRNIVNPSVL